MCCWALTYLETPPLWSLCLAGGASVAQQPRRGSVRRGSSRGIGISLTREDQPDHLLWDRREPDRHNRPSRQARLLLRCLLHGLARPLRLLRLPVLLLLVVVLSLRLDQCLFDRGTDGAKLRQQTQHTVTLNGSRWQQRSPPQWGWSPTGVRNQRHEWQWATPHLCQPSPSRRNCVRRRALPVCGRLRHPHLTLLPPSWSGLFPLCVTLRPLLRQPALGEKEEAKRVQSHPYLRAPAGNALPAAARAARADGKLGSSGRTRRTICQCSAR